MFTFLAIVHVVVSIIMIAFILLQDPKGGGGAFGMLGGGGSKSLFGNTGGNQFLVNVTKWTAVIFAFTSLYLAALSSEKDKSVMDEYTESAANTPDQKSGKDTDQTPKETQDIKQEETEISEKPQNREAPENIKEPTSQKSDVKKEEMPEEEQNPDIEEIPEEVQKSDK